MINIFSDNVSRAIAILNDEPVVEDVALHILEGYDTVETPQGKGFGVFIPEQKAIYVAGNLEEREIIFTVAHEFKHFMQFVSGAPYNEDDADGYAEMITSKILKK